MPANSIIQLRKGTAAEWAASNPILASGEPGYDLTNNIIKVGNGTGAWASLSGIGGGSSGLTEEQVDDRINSLLVAGTGIVLSYNDNANTLTVSTSGNYSLVGHSHSSSDITNFNSSVSGILPVKNIISGSGISVTSSGEIFTIGVNIIDCGIIVPTLTTPTAAYALDSNVNSADGLYNGTAYGSPSYVTGTVGNAIQLNTSGKYFTIPRSVSTNWTIAFFVNTSASSPNYDNWYFGISLVNGEAAGNTDDFGITYLKNKVAFGVGNPDTTLFSTSLINTGTWKHVACTRNSSTGLMKIYINGVFETSTTGPTGAKSVPSVLTVGGSVKYGSFNGLIDNLKLYTSVLSDSEILLLAGGS